MPKLSDVLTIKGLHLPNRLAMAPVLTGLAINNAPSQELLQWYHERALGGVGMVIVESTSIARDATILPFTLGIWDDAQIAGMANLAQVIKKQGLPAILQINHGGARSFREDLQQERIGPSAVSLMPGPAPRAMTEAEIITAIRDFKQAARRAVEAGFDGIEIHAAHYCLLSQFLSPYTNHRTDHWGGDCAKRTNLAVEVVQAVRQVVGEHYPIFCRINAVEYFNNGLDTNDIIFIAKTLEAAGVDVIDTSGIGYASMEKWQDTSFLSAKSVAPKELSDRDFAPYAGRIRQEVKVPIITVGKPNEPDAAQSILDKGQADIIAFARPLIADPMVAKKIIAGMNQDIIRCQECGACFAAIRQGSIKCPRLGL